MKLSMIAALAKHRVIGKDNKMPWHLPADLQFFKKTTMDSPIIMGRKTYDSIGRALPGRLNIILSHDKTLSIDGCTVVNSLDDALSVANGANEVFIIGGSHLYSTFINKVDRLYLTLIDEEFEGDTYFPDYTQYNWTEVQKQQHHADDKNLYSYTFLILDRLLETGISS